MGKTVESLKFLGEVSYMIGVLYHILFLKSFNISLDVDGQSLQKNVTFIELANSVYTGSTFVMAPDAVTDDGLIDVVIVNKLTRRRILKLLPSIFSGKHIHYQEVEVLKAQKITVSSDPVKAIIPDGELFGTTPISIECLHKDIQIFA